MVTSDNAAVVIPQIETNADIKQDIQNAIAAGKIVTISKSEVNHFGYRGIGYIIEDPQTGAAAYLIDGGRNGGDSPAPENVYPLPQIPLTPTVGFMLRSVLREAGAQLVADQNGMLVGLAFMGDASKFAPLGTGTGTSVVVRPIGTTALKSTVALTTVIFAVLLLTLTAVDTKFPLRNQPLILAKYSPSSRAISNFTERLIRASVAEVGDFATYGSGVYLGLRPDPVVGPVGCPPTASQQALIAAKYEIPGRGLPPKPEQVEAFVFFEITRDGIYDIRYFLNENTGVTEVLIKNPLLPGLIFVDNRPRLYIGPLAPGIAGQDLCF